MQHQVHIANAVRARGCSATCGCCSALHQLHGVRKPDQRTARECGHSWCPPANARRASGARAHQYSEDTTLSASSLAARAAVLQEAGPGAGTARSSSSAAPCCCSSSPRALSSAGRLSSACARGGRVAPALARAVEEPPPARPHLVGEARGGHGLQLLCQRWQRQLPVTVVECVQELDGGCGQHAGVSGACTDRVPRRRTVCGRTCHQLC